MVLFRTGAVSVATSASLPPAAFSMILITALVPSGIFFVPAHNVTSSPIRALAIAVPSLFQVRCTMDFSDSV